MIRILFGVYFQVMKMTHANQQALAMCLYKQTVVILTINKTGFEPENLITDIFATGYY